MYPEPRERPESPPQTTARVLHEARYYDALAWIYTLGRERAFRQRTLDLAQLQAGEAVLDVGCGTGTLALAAEKRMGAGGSVIGIDASPEMIARAQRKAARARSQVEFRTALMEALPFADGRFDVVLSTLMLHHLPRPVREQGAREIRRVLKPGGRALAIDFALTSREEHGLHTRLHHHGALDPTKMTDLLQGAGLNPIASGPVGFRNLHFVLATAPGTT